MPSISAVLVSSSEESHHAFTVLSRPNKNVNVVKPVQRIEKSDIVKPKPEDDDDFAFRVLDEDLEDVFVDIAPDKIKKQQRQKATSLLPHHMQSHTILDPHFSRRLDLKLRRLKEKEIIAERLARRQRELLPEPTVIQKTVAKREVAPSSHYVRPKVINLELPPHHKEIIGTNSGGGKSPDKSESRNNLDQQQQQHRPLFITTVRKGEFLPPPASMAALLGMTNCERQGGVAGVPTLMYTYCSRPKILGVRTAEKGTETAKGALVHLASLAVAAATIRSRASQSNYGNLMTDRRVIRGSTSNFHGTGLLDGYDVGEGDAARGARAAAARRRAVARRRGPGVSGALAGSTNRRNEPVQTDPYLEELYDKGREMEVGIQTDLMLDRVDTPIYVSSAYGSDVATQVLPGELFDFESEVEPVLEILVDKTIEQALAECLEEEELAHLRKQAAAATEVREQAVASARHRQRHLIRIQNDKEKRAEFEEEVAERLKAERHAAAEAVVKAHLPHMLPTILETIKEQGFIDAFPDMGDTFMSWLTGEVTVEIENMITSRYLLTDIVKEVIETRFELSRVIGEDETISSSVMTSETSNKNEYDQIEDGEILDEQYDKHDIVE